MTEERTPPQKIRVTSLQEAQLLPLQAVEAHCAGQFHEAGFTPEQWSARKETEIARLTRDHDVLVAEADGTPAGYLAWIDQAPGVAYIETLMVGPEWQRFGVGTRLLREVGESAKRANVGVAVAAPLEGATWALAFLAVRGFRLQDGALPAKLQKWRAEHGPRLAEQGRTLLWAESDGLGTVPGLPRPA